MCSTADFKRGRVPIGILSVPPDKFIGDSACQNYLRCLCRHNVFHAVRICDIKNALQIKPSISIIIPEVADTDFFCHRLTRYEGLIVSAEISKHLNGILRRYIGERIKIGFSNVPKKKAIYNSIVMPIAIMAIKIHLFFLSLYTSTLS